MDIDKGWLYTVKESWLPPSPKMGPRVLSLLIIRVCVTKMLLQVGIHVGSLPRVSESSLRERHRICCFGPSQLSNPPLPASSGIT